MAFCPRCGKPTQETDEFCRNCGHHLIDESTPAPIETSTQSAPTEPIGAATTAPPAAPAEAPSPPPVPPRSGMPSWLPIAIIAGVVVMGAVVALLLLRGGDEPTPVATVDFPVPTTQPTEEALDALVLGEWVCETEDNSYQATIQPGTWSITDESGDHGEGTWTYDPAATSVSFSGSAPEGGTLEGSVTARGNEVIGSFREPSESDADPQVIEGTIGPGDTATLSEPAAATCRAGSG